MFTFSPNTRIKSTQVNQNFTDLGSGAGDVDGNRLQLFRAETCFDFTQSGLIWTQTSGLNGSMSVGVCYIADANLYMNRLAIASIASRAFTASKDTYVDVSSVGAITYTEAANSATAPTLPTYSMRIALVVTGASAITGVFQTDQKQASTTLTDLGWPGVDNAGYPVRNTSPFAMEFRFARHNGTNARSNPGANGTFTSLVNMAFNYRSGRTKEKIIYDFGAMFVFTAANGNHQMFVYNGASQVYPQAYNDVAGGLWGTRQISTYPTYLAANTAVNISLKAIQNQTLNYTDAATDQQFMLPTVTVKVTKAA